MKVLITGADGQLGWELQQVSPEGWKVTALNRYELDITDHAAVTAVIQQHRPDLIINSAAYTAVDKAEIERDMAYAVNAEGAGLIARAAQNCLARLIHISTDFVFDGMKPEPYRPDDRPNPVSVYGASKLKGEQIVSAETQDNALILRTGWLYSSHGNNFVKTMLKLMAEKDELRIVADQTGTPTWARGLAEAIYRLAAILDIKGIYHWTDSGTASWFDFAAAIQEEAIILGILKNRIPVKPIRTEEYPTPAKRPSNSVLDKNATWKTLGYKAPQWRDSLRMMLEELKKENH